MTARSVRLLMTNSSNATLRLSPRFERKLRNWFGCVPPETVRKTPLVGAAFAHCLQRGGVQLARELLVQGYSEPRKFVEIASGDEAAVGFREVNVDTADWLLGKVAPHIKVRDTAREGESAWIQDSDGRETTQRIMLSRMLRAEDTRDFDRKEQVRFSPQFVYAVGFATLFFRPFVSQELLFSRPEIVSSATAFALDPAEAMHQISVRLNRYFIESTIGQSELSAHLLGKRSLASLISFQFYVGERVRSGPFPVSWPNVIDDFIIAVTAGRSDSALLDHRQAPPSNIDAFEAAARRMFHPEDLRPIRVKG